MVIRKCDSFPIGVSVDSCPLNGPRQQRHLIRAQLVYVQLIGAQSTGHTPAGHESNGAVSGDH